MKNHGLSLFSIGFSPMLLLCCFDTAGAQITLTANPSQLTFNYQIGQPAPGSETVSIGSTDAPLNYQVSTNTTQCGGFLAATPLSGSTFGSENQIVVGVSTAGFTSSQVCKGNVLLTVTGTSTAIQIRVTLNVSNGVLLNVGPSSVNVTALAFSTAPIQRTISVTSTDNSIQAFNITTNSPGIGPVFSGTADQRDDASKHSNHP